MAIRQRDAEGRYALSSKPVRQRLRGTLSAAVGVGIKGQVDGSHTIAQLTKLVCVELSSHRAGNVPLATEIGPLRQFNLAHPRLMVSGQVFS